MKSKLLSRQDGKTFALVFDKGEEVVERLLGFAREHDLRGSHFTAIGAFSDLTLGFFDWETKEYSRLTVGEQVEVLSLIGDIALDRGEPKVHAHVVVGKRDGSAHGGHLMEGHVRPTLEMILTESPSYLQRRPDAETGLALIEIG